MINQIKQLWPHKVKWQFISQKEIYSRDADSTEGFYTNQKMSKSTKDHGRITNLAAWRYLGKRTIYVIKNDLKVNPYMRKLRQPWGELQYSSFNV